MELRMKKLLVLLTSLILSCSLFAEIKDFNDYREKKMSLYCEEDYKTVNSNINSELALLRNNKSNYSEEEFLTYETFLIIDSLFFNLEENELPKEKEDYFSNLFLSQEEKMEDYMGKRKLKEFSSNFLLALGDLKCQMPYVISIPKSIPKLKDAKEIYEQAVQNDPSSSASLMSYSLWYEYSPGIAGGSHKKAYEIMCNAEKKAKTNVDKFFAKMFKSQILNSLKKYDESIASMKEAHALFPTETFSDYLIKELEIDVVL